MLWSEVKGPGKPYWRIPDGLTGELGMGSGPDRPGAGEGRDDEVVEEGKGGVMGVMGVAGCCLCFEE